MAVALFRGQEASALDSKGRFSLPVNFRNVLAQTCEETGLIHLRADPARPYLTLFGTKVLRDYEDDVERRAAAARDSHLDFDRETLENKIFGPIEDASIDTGGRFTIPLKMRNRYGIGELLFMVGSGRMIHLWAPEKYIEWPEADPMHQDECRQLVADLATRRKGRT